MVTIIGNGVGEYDFSNIDIDLSSFDEIICDKNFKENGEKIVKLPFKEAKEYILKNHTNKNLAYIVTGSPLFYSAGTLITKYISDFKIIDNTSSFTYLLQKLGISMQECSAISLHGRDEVDLEEFLKKRYTFVLCDHKTTEKLREILYFVKDKIEVVLGYRLGFEDESIEKIDLYKDDFDTTKLYVLLIKKLFVDKSPLSCDDDFEKENGMITKRYKRDLSLQNLDLLSNQLLWDIGAGSGSCAIEAYKRYKVRTVLFEKNPLRAKMIENNLINHNVIDTKLLIGKAEELFEKEEKKPDRIFIGGGGKEVIKKIAFLFEMLKEGGIILINVISLKHLSLMIEILDSNKIKYEIFSFSITTYKGKLDMAEPQRVLFQIKIKK